MPKFLCMQRSIPTDHVPEADAGPGASFAAFQAWIKRFEKNLVDLGGKVGGGTLVTAETTTDTNPVEVRTLIGGYMIVSGDSLDAAVEVAKACPGLVRPGSGVEVVEIHGP